MNNINEIYPYKTDTELKNEFPDYWVLLINANYNRDQELVGGNFVAKGKDHTKVWQKSKMIDVQGVTFSNYFTGTIKVPDNVIICL